MGCIEGHPKPFEVYGDDTLFTGKGGTDGAQITSETAQLSHQSIRELLKDGKTQITTQSLLERFPSRAGDQSTSMASLKDWAFGKEQWAIDNVFSSASFLAKRAGILISPRILDLSKDQVFQNKWATSLPKSGFQYTDTLMVGDKLFAGGSGQVYELQPKNGDVLRQSQVLTVSDETHIASDGKRLYAGVYGNVIALNLAAWANHAWRTPMPGMSSWPVRLFVVNDGIHRHQWVPHRAGSQPRSEARQKTVSSAYGADVRFASDGQTLFVS